MKHIKNIFIIVIGILVFSVPGLTADNSSEKCPDDNKSIVVCDSVRLTKELQERRILQDENKELVQVIAELNTQIGLINQQVKLLNEKIQASEDLRDAENKINNEKIESLEKDLKEAEKPRYKAMAASAGVGSILTIVLLLALGI